VHAPRPRPEPVVDERPDGFHDPARDVARADGATSRIGAVQPTLGIHLAGAQELDPDDPRLGERATEGALVLRDLEQHQAADLIGRPFGAHPWRNDDLGTRAAAGGHDDHHRYHRIGDALHGDNLSGPVADGTGNTVRASA
jgi:hypothetical protein